LTGLEDWLAHQGAVFLLEATRIGAMMLAGPLSWSFMPMRARAGFVILLTVMIHAPTRAVDLHSLDPISFLLCTMSEFAIGASIGYIARLVLAVGELAADAVAPIMGLGAAQMFDPQLGGQGTILTRVLRYVGTWVGLAVGLHHLLLGAVFRSFSGMPTGTLVSPGVLAPKMIQLTSEVLVSGVQLALPMVAVLFVAQVGLAFIARAAPAMQIFAIGFAVTLGVGFLLWIVFAPDIVRELSYLRVWAEESLIQVIHQLEGR